jgi:predicted  nucleic acid-binding Zn-ribbon protein
MAFKPYCRRCDTWHAEGGSCPDTLIKELRQRIRELEDPHYVKGLQAEIERLLRESSDNMHQCAELAIENRDLRAELAAERERCAKIMGDLAETLKELRPSRVQEAVGNKWWNAGRKSAFEQSANMVREAAAAIRKGEP